MSIMSTPMSVNSSFEWLHHQGIQVSDRLAKEGWIADSRIVRLLSDQFLSMCELAFNANTLLTEINQRVGDPDGMTPDEKEEVRRDHVEGDK